MHGTQNGEYARASPGSFPSAGRAGERVRLAMIAKKDLLRELQALVGIEQEVLSLCSRQLGNPSFFSGIALEKRPEVRAGLEAFQGRSEQHRQVLEKLMTDIFSDGRDVY